MSEIGYKIDSVFNQIKKKLKISEFYELSITKIWKDVTGDVISQVSIPIHLEDGVLTVNVRDTIWLNQLTLLKKEIIKQINENLGKEVVKDIKYKVGVLKFKELEEPDNVFVDIDEVKLNNEDVIFIENAVSIIEDRELRERFRNFFIVALKRRYLDEKKGKK